MIEAIIGTIPVMIVGGFAMKVAERTLPASNCFNPGRKVRSGGRGRGLARGRGRGPIGRPSRLPFGNFSNVGL